MLLLTTIKDMSPTELLGVIKPFLYLLPLAVTAIVALLLFKLYNALRVKRMILHMSASGGSHEEKREYLKNYLMGASARDLIANKRNCPVCGKKYSTSEGGKCPYCNTEVRTLPATDYRSPLRVMRTPTASFKEAEYREVFEKLENYISVYEPYLDGTPDPSDSSSGTVSVNININIH